MMKSWTLFGRILRVEIWRAPFVYRDWKVSATSDGGWQALTRGVTLRSQGPRRQFIRTMIDNEIAREAARLAAPPRECYRVISKPEGVVRTLRTWTEGHGGGGV